MSMSIASLKKTHNKELEKALQAAALATCVRLGENDWLRGNYHDLDFIIQYKCKFDSYNANSSWKEAQAFNIQALSRARPGSGITAIKTLPDVVSWPAAMPQRQRNDNLHLVELEHSMTSPNQVLT